MIYLDANNPEQVDSHRVLEVDLLQPNHKMLILSGIARPEWVVTDDAHIYQEQVMVNLRRSVLAIEQATVSVGLASFGNANTDFQFACDSASLDVDPNSQELLLNADLALEGDPSRLNRFGYQVVTLVTTQTTGISGTIRWEQHVFDASGLTPGQAAQLFRITANHVEEVHPPDGFSYLVYTALADGVATGFDRGGDDFLVPYEIPGAPYNQPLVIRVEVGTGFRSQGPPSAAQIAGPMPVVLTLAVPGVEGVDFRVTAAPLR